MKISMIAAVAKNNAIGLQGDMPWKNSLKGDLKFFKKVTMGHPVVMGRKTWESLQGRCLPGRKNIVITHANLPKQENLEVFHGIDEFLDAYKQYSGRVYIIGGATLYEQFLPYADQLVLTEIEKEFPADTYFPFFDSTLYTRQEVETNQDGEIIYHHVFYDQK